MTNRCSAILAACFALAAGPALAGDAKLDAAIKTFTDTGNDPKQLGIYCQMNALVASAQSEEDIDAAKVADLLDKLGLGFAAAIHLDGQLTPGSADAKAYRAAMDILDRKCPKWRAGESLKALRPLSPCGSIGPRVQFGNRARRPLLEQSRRRSLCVPPAVAIGATSRMAVVCADRP